MMSLPALHELAFLPTEEAEEIIAGALPKDVLLQIFRAKAQWCATLCNPAGDIYWEGASPDRRILLFDAYGYVLQEAGVKPKHPAWRRRGEIQVPEQYGAKAHQNGLHIPDPEDLSPAEILSIYGIQPTKKDMSK
jgi:hypothetical protein